MAESLPDQFFHCPVMEPVLHLPPSGVILGGGTTVGAVTTADIAHAARLLVEMYDTMRTIPQLPDGLRPGSPDEAYAIQAAVVETGAWEVGALKVGCTSTGAQQALGIDEPIAGLVGRHRMESSGVVLDMSSFHHTPFIECEFALRVGSDVKPEDDVSELAGVHDVVDAVAPAVELVDSRFDDMFSVGPHSLMADNSGFGTMVLGEPVDPAAVDALETVAVTLSCDGEELARGVGADVMGDPYRALRWVLGHELRHGRTVAAGTWVITGTCTGLVPFPLGNQITASFAGLGDADVTLS